MNTYDVTISFELPAESEQDAIDFARELLEGMEQYDQLPYWYITGASELPSDEHFERLALGETPLDSQK